MKAGFMRDSDAMDGSVSAAHLGESSPKEDYTYVDVGLIRRMRALANDELAAVTELGRDQSVVGDVQFMFEDKRALRPEMAERLARACGDAIADCARALQADLAELENLLRTANGPDGATLMSLNSASPSGRYLIFGNHYLLDSATARIYPIGVSPWLALKGEARVDGVTWIADSGELVAFKLTWLRRSVHVQFDLKSWRAVEAEQNRFETLKSEPQIRNPNPDV